MHHEVRGQRQTGVADQRRHRQLARMAATEAADTVGVGRLGILEAELHMIEAGIRQRHQRRRVECHA